MTQITVKVIHIKADEQRIIVKRVTAAKLEKLKKTRKVQKPREHPTETYNDVIVRICKL